MEVFRLFGSIFVNTDEAKKSISDTAKNAQDLGKKLQKTGGQVSKAGKAITRGVTAVSGAVVGIGAGLIGIATKAGDAADEIDKMSQRLGMSRQTYQELNYVLSQSGVDINSFQTGMKSLLKNMDGVTEGNKNSVAMFEKLGVAVTDSTGKMRSQEEVLLDTIRAFQGMEDSAEKSRLAQELFGKQGQEILPLLNSQSGSMDELIQKANELGLVMSDKTIDAGVKLHDTMDSLKRSFEQIGVSLGAEVIPYVEEFSEYLIEHMPEIRDTMASLIDVVGKLAKAFFGILKWFGELDSGSQKTIIVIGLIIGALGPLVTIIGSVITLCGQLSVAFGVIAPFVTGTLVPAFMSFAAVLTGPILAAIGAVVAAIVVWVKNWDDIKEAARLAIEEIADLLERIKNKFKRDIEAIKSFIKLPHFKITGDLSLNPPSVPKLSVDWYAKAMNNPIIMNSPTAFGINSAGNIMAGGESGPEVVSGADTLMNMISGAVSGQSGNIYDSMVAALIYVFENYGIKVDVNAQADKDSLFRSMRVMNSEFKKMNGNSAFA